MATSPTPLQGSLMIAIFDELTPAELALDELRIAGFHDGQLGLAVHQGGATGQGVSTGIISRGLRDLGIPDETAQTCERELEAGRALVAVKPEGVAANGRPMREEALEILRDNGARLVDTSSAQP